MGCLQTPALVNDGAKAVRSRINEATAECMIMRELEVEQRNVEREKKWRERERERERERA